MVAPGGQRARMRLVDRAAPAERPERRVVDQALHDRSRCRRITLQTRVADIASIVARLLDVSNAQEGNLIVEWCPTEWKKSLPVWGRPPDDLSLQKAVKRALDAKGIFNPGRFVTDVL